MDPRIPSVHQTMEQGGGFRGSPASLCSRCSVRCSGGHQQQQPPTLPLCNCMSSAAIASGSGSPLTLPHQPFCNIHSSVPHLQQLQSANSSRTLNNSYHNPHQQCNSPATVCSLHHSASPVNLELQLHQQQQQHSALSACTLHHPTAVSNQRYADSSRSPAPDAKTKDRSLSPFAFLRKNNRDSKASSNTILDNASSKSALMSCNRKWLVAIVLTLVLIILVSVAVGLVVTFTGNFTDL